MKAAGRMVAGALLAAWAARGEDLHIEGNLQVSGAISAGERVVAPSLRAPFSGALLLENTPSGDWSHLNVLDMDGESNRYVMMGGGGPNSLNLGVVKLWGGSTLDIGTYDNSPMLMVANVANGGMFQTVCTWNNIWAGSINGWGSSNALAYAEFTGTTLGLLSLLGGSRATFTWNEASLIGLRLEDHSWVHCDGASGPVLLVGRARHHSEVQVVPGGTAAVVVHQPGGEKSLVGAAGTLTVGASLTNTHLYATVLGRGLSSVEANAVHARKFIATEDITVGGRPVATLTYVPPQGDIPMGCYTNAASY